MYIIAVNKSQELLLNVCRLLYIFFRPRRKGFDFDDIHNEMECLDLLVFWRSSIENKFFSLNYNLMKRCPWKEMGIQWEFGGNGTEIKSIIIMGIG